MLKAARSLVSVCAVFCLASMLNAAPSIPLATSFQAVITDAAGHRLSGTADMTFNYYDAATGGTLLLTETQPADALANGLLNTSLGTGTLTAGAEADFNSVFQNHGAVFVEVTAKHAGITETLAPRAQIQSAPFALHSSNADSLGGFDSSYFLNSGATGQLKYGDTSGPLLQVSQAGIGSGIVGTVAEGYAVAGYASDYGVGINGDSTNGTGITGTSGFGSGAGDGVSGQTGTGNGVHGSATSGGAGVLGESSGGTGVLGTTVNGVAVKASGQGTATTVALQIDNGALRITGSDIGHKAAFIQTATASNSFTSFTGRPAYFTRIDNAYCNGDPSAIIIATHNYDPNFTLLNRPFGVFYSAPYWNIYLEDQGPAGAASIVGQSFNVLVIKQ